MIYKKFDDELLASQIEEFLVKTLIEASTLTPVKREQYYEQAFSQVREKLKLPQSNDHDIIFTNINPYKHLFLNRHCDVLLKAQKDRLPLIGDGYFAYLTKKQNKRVNYAVSNLNYPLTEHSIIKLKEESFLLKIKKASEIDLYKKCYGIVDDYEESHVEALVRVFMEPGFDFSNVKCWIDRAVVAERIAEASCRVINLDRKPTGSYSIKNDDEHSNSHGKLLITLLGDQKNKYSIYRVMFDLPISKVDNETLSDLANKIKYGCDALMSAHPKEAKYLRGDLLTMSLDMNFGWEGNVIFLSHLKSLYTSEEIIGYTRTKHIPILSKAFDMPTLLKAASSKQKRDHLINDMDI